MENKKLIYFAVFESAVKQCISVELNESYSMHHSFINILC